MCAQLQRRTPSMRAKFAEKAFAPASVIYIFRGARKGMGGTDEKLKRTGDGRPFRRRRQSSRILTAGRDDLTVKANNFSKDLARADRAGCRRGNEAGRRARARRFSILIIRIFFCRAADCQTNGVIKGFFYGRRPA